MKTYLNKRIIIYRVHNSFNTDIKHMLIIITTIISFKKFK